MQKAPKTLASLGRPGQARVPVPTWSVQHLVWDAYNHGSSAGEFLVWKFCFEFQVEAQAEAFLQSGVVEKIDHVSAKATFKAAALV